ncbi:MAG: hypothetical protein FJ116_06145, partial [Deltaproteobacteria bacterium]|nr:hypothetical protein [Deltaproteobacteria bacterium]
MNKNTSNAAQQPQLTVSNSRLYLSWIETSGAKFQIRVALYNGNDSAPSWLFVDGKNVDISKGALKFSEQFHSLDKKKFRYVAADVFSWVE